VPAKYSQNRGREMGMSVEIIFNFLYYTEMSDTTYSQIFRSGSRTYFYSSLFFSKSVKQEVAILYSFVRTADNFVDAVPQQETAFYAFKKQYYQRLKTPLAPESNSIISGFVELQTRYQFQQAWVDSFLDAMESDLKNPHYATLAEVESYMYGSAEVVGLMMSQILKLPVQAHEAAQALGKSMQYANFLRDIAEDLELGRTYLPQEILLKYGLKTLSRTEALQKTTAFKKCIRTEIQRYRLWAEAGKKGYNFIPLRLRIPIKTATDMYDWTMVQIANDPFLVFERKVKPSVPRIMTAILYNTLTSCL